MKWFAPYLFFCLISFCFGGNLQAQTTLPHFHIKDLGTAGVQISWVNPYKNCQQLSVQRGTDSLHFKTILHAHTPNMNDNGFIDKSIATRPLYYRIYFVLEGGKFYFSTIQQVGQDHGNANSTNHLQPWKPSKYVYCIGKGAPTVQLPEARKHLYRLVFMEESGKTIFEINGLREIETYIDKSNFVHTGWFLFDLYEDNMIKEKGRLLIQKD